jgi:TRAP-type C4-dicarboxylate transport system substrate-binding protein
MKLKSWLAVIATSTALSSTAIAQEITLKYATAAPAAHYLEAQGGKKFIDRIVELTNGKVKIEYYPAGQLGKADKMGDLAESGVTDIAAIGSAYVTNTMPLAGLFELPGVYLNACGISEVYNKLKQEGTALHTTDIANKNYRVLFTAGPGNNEFSGRGESFNGPEDFKGKRVRAAGGIIADVVTSLGGAPVRVSSPETYEIYSRGTVDAILIPWPSLIGYDLHTLSKFTTQGLGFAGGFYFWAINNTTWNRLPEDVQSAIEQAASEVEQSLCTWTEEHIANSKKTLEEAGVTVIEIDAAKRAKFEEALAPFVDGWAKALDQRGIPGSKGLEEFRAAIQSIESSN